ncbi:MAG TPA: MBL fold metallo-hydrolase [Lachnospiraceae bacterium]|nr:MBL fold metallo-hydrolase [Lachnospiraceae bacterium]
MRASGEETGEESRGAGGMVGPENEANPGQGNADTIHETGQSIRQPDSEWPAGGNTEPGSNRQPAGGNEETPEVTEELEIHFLDVGQGDCTLLLCGGEAMLIDAGDNEQGTRIQNYLRKQNVETLKYVVCTHPDEDHIGGMDVILYKFDCETILMTEEDKDTNTCRDVVDTMKNRGYERTLPVVGQQYSLGDACFTILAPSDLGDDSNNNSIAILLTHGSNSILFTGDAEEEEEAEMLNSGILKDVDVYKAGHHGSRTSSSERLLEAVLPEYAVISCGEGNSYGHPHAETMNAFRALGIQVFRTDEQGSIVLTSDGSEILWNCSPSATWLAGEPVGSNEAVSYICNTNTKKFHYPECSSVEQMEEKNKLPTSATREELIDQGYDPCKKCNP